MIHPKVNKQFNYIHKGGIPVGEWVRIEWTLRERSMEVAVNGEIYHTQEGYFGDLHGKAGIGCDNGTVTVQTFTVESLDELEIAPRLPVDVRGKKDWLVPDPSCYPTITPDGLWLTCDEHWGSARTLAAYPVPFTLTARLRTDTGTVVMYGGLDARVAFHSDGSISFLDPVKKEEIWADKKGQLPDGNATIAWTMEADRTTVSVDGEVRLEQRGDYGPCRFRLGIGADLGSVVTVHSVTIE